MNDFDGKIDQAEMTERVANALYASRDFESVGTIRTVYSEQPPRVLAKDLHGTVWSVTVEILAQP